MMKAQYRDLHLTLLNGVNEVQEKLNGRVLRYYLVAIVVMLVFTFGCSRHAAALSDQIAEPIEALDAAANLVRRGELNRFEDVVVRQPSYDEITSLAGTFNTMVRQLQDYIRVIEENARTAEKLHHQELENLRIASLLKTSELKALQMQMNPHFLFNTLNMISRTADLGDTDRTVLLLQKTAQLLRYNLDYSGKIVTLAKEIEMLGNYVFLQEQRFGNRISFEFDLDERFHQTEVPCFILQPLIENAVIHGLGGSGGKGTIIIRTEYLEAEQEGRISILDDGAGMDEETRKQVLGNLNSDEEQREKIGLANINMRLRLIRRTGTGWRFSAVPERGLRYAYGYGREGNPVCNRRPLVSDRLIFLIYQRRHSIVFFEGFTVIACPAKTVCVGDISDAAI